jgi:hypothetical protein
VSFQEWTYHGARLTEWPWRALHVEEPTFGTTERKAPKVLRSLRADDVGWGYNGTGTSNAASRILADALELGDPGKAGMGLLANEYNEVLYKLSEDFCDEVLTQMATEWWLSRTAVLRWALGWYSQLEIRPMPAVLRRLPAPGTIHERWVAERRAGLEPQE